ncbi:MAG: molybdopterin-dependent oxidoreductase [Acidobacteriota bacterium]|nr:molybdopterin-dependent oxidoreductase [Acidobacteriota bacterium]
MKTGIPDSTVASFKGITRRLFLKIAGGIVMGAGIPSSLYAYFVNSLFVRTVEKDSFRFNAKTGMIEWKERKPEAYRLKIDGLVQEKKSFSYSDLQALPQIEQVSDFHCVEGWSVQDIRWGGFRFREILSLVEPKPQATHVIFHSFGTTSSAPEGQAHYIESFPIGELLDPKRDMIFALTMNRDPLPEDHGAPLRLIAPYDMGYKSIKYISRMEFARDSRPGWWTLANPMYPMEARVPEKRLRKQNR